MMGDPSLVEINLDTGQNATGIKEFDQKSTEKEKIIPRIKNNKLQLSTIYKTKNKPDVPK